MRPSIKPTGEKYYEYIICYVDDMLFIFHNPGKHMNDIQSILKFNNDKVDEPGFYLGENLSKKELNGRQV